MLSSYVIFLPVTPSFAYSASSISKMWLLKKYCDTGRGRERRRGKKKKKKKEDGGRRDVEAENKSGDKEERRGKKEQVEMERFRERIMERRRIKISK